MTYQVLARKWRPQNFDEVLGQKHITSALSNSLKRDRVGHAYVFSGTRGVGKTTIARILAKSLRCLKPIDKSKPCETCDGCIDFNTAQSMNVIEIDGASNNSVDDIRDLILNVHALPSFGNKKIYIIDEVHMLSKSAFNALLKTLEEPPEHIVFIFATTEPHKIPDTVLSRCQRYDFKHMGTTELKDYLKTIAKKEGITFEKEELVGRIAKMGDGSVRDSFSLLDQVMSFSLDKKITEEELTVALGVPKVSSITQIKLALFNEDTVTCSRTYRELLERGISLENIIVDLLEELFIEIEKLDTQSSEVELDASEVFWIYETLSKDLDWSQSSIIPIQTTEVVLRKICLRRTLFSGEKKKTNLESSNPEVKVEVFVPKSWDEFLNDLNNKSPAFASNLEQGNIVGEIIQDRSVLELKIGFGPEAKIFHDYVTEKENVTKLRSFLCTFFDKNDEKVKLDFDLLKDEDKKEDGFLSKVEIKDKIEEEARDKIKDDFKNHPMMVKAQEIFGSKIDKIKVVKK